MSIEEEMYREELLEHYREPQNYGIIKNPSAHYKDFNPVCGDEVEVYLKIKENKLEDVKFTGKGCAISQAAASILTGHIKGKKTGEIKKMAKEEMLGLLPIKVSNLRIKCALLAMKAMQKATVNYEGRKNGRA